MHKFLIILTLTSLLFSNCKKTSCDVDSPNIAASEAERTTIKNHLTANSLSAIEHSSGIFYSIVADGNNDKPNLCSNVSVKYVGKLLNGNIFDQSANTVTFALSNLIIGWQIGIPLIGAEGKIKLYIPPSLAYGSSATGNIPANSTLIFDIDLIAFQKGN